MSTEIPLYFQKGFGLKKEIQGDLIEKYHSGIVDYFKNHQYTLEVNDLTFRLAKEFGFCYGVDRAVEYTYETRKKFPDKTIYLTGEIIHNPFVNEQIRSLGIHFLNGTYHTEKNISDVTPADVVILPAFGVSLEEMKQLADTGCILVDTTCGSVLNVWKNVERYAKDGFTSVVHGKYYHEETQATCSRALRYPGGQYLVVKDLKETDYLCHYILHGANPEEFRTRFAKAVSPGFHPNVHLQKIGVANQTTMLSGESLEVAFRIGETLKQKYGTENQADHFRNFDTICSATQERQDAIVELLSEPLDLMLIIGGYNSSNTNNLVAISEKKIKTFHINDVSCIETPETLRHKPFGASEEIRESHWLPDGPLRIGLTAGASTPNSIIGMAVEKILFLKGYSLPSGIGGSETGAWIQTPVQDVQR